MNQTTEEKQIFDLTKDEHFTEAQHRNFRRRISNAAKFPDQFESPDLLHKIFEVLDDKHKGDDPQKLVTMVTLANAKRQPKHRFSLRLIGNSSEGKDNLIDTCAEHLPDGHYEKVTSESDKYFERADSLPPALNFGELNLLTAERKRVELLKALSEGGSSYGYLENFGKTEAKIKIPRHVCAYTTCEVGVDDELATRCLSVSVRGTKEQTEEVLGYYGNSRSNPEKVLRGEKTEESWIAAGVKSLTDYPVLIPYAKAVTDCVDSRFARSRRDGKKLLDFIEAVTIIHQSQRPLYLHEKTELLVATPADLKFSLEILDDTLNQSYNAIEPRLQKAIQAIERETKQIEKDSGPGAPTWIPQRDLVKKLGLSDKHKALAIFDRLEELLVIDRQRSETDKRAFEIRLTGKTGIPLINRERNELLENAKESFHKNLDALGADKITPETRQFIEVKSCEVFPNDEEN